MSSRTYVIPSEAVRPTRNLIPHNVPVAPTHVIPNARQGGGISLLFRASKATKNPGTIPTVIIPFSRLRENGKPAKIYRFHTPASNQDSALPYLPPMAETI
mgnify:FL=1